MRPTIVLFVPALLIACGESSPTEVPEGEFRVVDTAPSAAVAAATESLAADLDIDHIATNGGAVYFSSAGRVFEVETGSMVERRLYREGDDPAVLGPVHQLAPRADGGLWVAADSGLFILDALYVSYVSLELDATIHTITEARNDGAAGAMSGLWAGTELGLIHLSAEATDTLIPPGVASTNVEQLAVTDDGTLAVAVYDGQLVQLELESEAWTADQPPIGATVIHGLAASSNAAFVAADNGLFRYRRSDAPKWTHYTLGGTAALAVTTDDAGTAWVRTGDQLIAVTAADGLRAYDLDPREGAATVAIDDRGDAWTSVGAALTRTRPSDTPATSFATDLAPWVETRCAACHSSATQDFAEYEVFASVAEDALSRVQRGDMPRCEGSRVCAPSEQLDAENYAVLDRWIREGKQP